MVNELYQVVVIGPESTGKSTLCMQLADYFQTVWCPEFAREYLEEHGKDYSYEDLLKIAMGQVSLEKDLAAKANKVYFIDTDMYVMKVWCEVAFEQCHSWILKQIASRQYSLYLLCNIDLPWVPDHLREYPELEVRKRLYKMYQDRLINSGCRWVEISGTFDERLHMAVSIVNAVCFNKGKN